MTLLEDRLAIHDLVMTYCRGIDRLDLDLVRSVYTADGVDHHTGFDGTVAEFIVFLQRALPRLDGTQHILGNHLAEVRGDVAVAETYGTAVHWGTPSDDRSRNFTSGVRYVDHLVRTDAGWRIRERWAAREWTVSWAGRALAPEGPGPRGTRDRTDPLYLARSRAGLETAPDEPGETNR